MKVAQSCPTLCNPMTILSMEFSRPEYWSEELFPSPGHLPNLETEPTSPSLQTDSLLLEPQGKPKNTGVGSLSLLQQIFLTQELNQGLLHCRWILYQLSYEWIPEYAELYRKDFNDPDKHDGVISNLETDILECKAKCALGSVTMDKANRGDGIPAGLLKILKDDGMKVLHSTCQQIWKTQQWPQNWKRSVFIPIPKKGNAKECSNYHTIALILPTSKTMLKILQARLQQYMIRELPDVQGRFRKGRQTRDQIANIHWIIEKARGKIPEKHLLLLHWLC